uniref:RING-type domain-containing protein n=1 Tax=Caenorhabditis tropicalis TaxID=1561998 RepID=A0A1I7UB86_9PELO
MMISTNCPSRQSHSDYYSLASSCSSSCSEDDGLPFFEQELKPLVDASSAQQEESPSSLPVGVCPHCFEIFDQPVSLQCGHSLCLTCCNKLVFSIPSANTSHIKNLRPRMGISQRAPSTIPGSTGFVLYRTPKCPVCSAPPSRAGPVPNLALEHLLRNMRTFRWNQIEKDATSRGTRKWEDNPIQDCRIAVLGSSKVGKTCFTMVQNGNEVMFPDKYNDSEDADAYMVEILDRVSIERASIASNGIIIMYSIVDKNSFYNAADIFKKLEHKREHNQPVILVGSKKDLSAKRMVSYEEGQLLATQLGVPFMEVSSKYNDCVFEAFEELVSMIQKQNYAFKNIVKQILV